MDNGKKKKRRSRVREMSQSQILRESDAQKCSGQFQCRAFSFETCLLLQLFKKEKQQVDWWTDPKYQERDRKPESRQRKQLLAS